MHERSRRVPKLEQWIHAGLGVTIGLFFTMVFRGESQFALASLTGFAVLVAFDELQFHQGIATREKRIHQASWVALAVFVCAWQWIDSYAEPNQ